MKYLVAFLLILFSSVCWAEDKEPIKIVVPNGSYYLVIQTDAKRELPPEYKDGEMFLNLNGQSAIIELKGNDDAQED